MPNDNILNDALPSSETRHLGDDIRSSWIRCLSDHHLEPNTVPDPHVLTRPEIQDATAPIEELIAVASPEIQRLFDRLAGDGYLVSVGSTEGVNLIFRSDYDLAGHMEPFGIVPGAIWSEQNQGTNGMGTCIQTQNPVSVVESDHFDSKVKSLTCTDAPVFGPGGKL